MSRDRLQYELTPIRKYKFNRIKDEMLVSNDSEAIDIMLKQFLKVLDDESITVIEYKNKLGEVVAVIPRKWFFQ